MALPSTRELELEALVRQRDAQIQELNDDITRLRRHLSTQQAPAPTDSVTLPPPILSVLRPHIRAAARESSPASSTVVNALIQRSRLLQEENDELYEILKVKETGKLKEEARGLRRVVHRLESGLRESHSVIAALTTELEKTNEALMATSKHINAHPHPEPRHESRSPRNAYRETSSMNNGSARHPPTGPRAFKKQRLSDTHDDSPPPLPPPPVPRPPPSNAGRQHGGNMSNTNSSRQGGEQHYQRHSNSYSGDRERDREQRDFGAGLPSKPQTSRPASNKMDVDDDKKERRSRGDRDRQRGDAPPSGPGSSTGYEKDRDRERTSGHSGGGGGGAKDRGSGKGGSSTKDRAVTISGGTSLSSRDRNRTGGGGGRDHDRNADNGMSRSSQGHHTNNANGHGGGGRRNGTSHTGNSSSSTTLSVRGAGRRNDQRTTGPPSTSQEAFDRSLAERMGL
ncbi:hypothetical protein BKA70DRAFT_1420266 [Coprinopsis sp. MPI-PUGE-AT-0042]|nr:hypothetical protein BKA70DRAFT_1420266 [Coprinopsis sp. MPI-PUGE-AT-0042]